MLLTKSKLILGFALTALLASCGGPATQVIEFDDKFEGEAATSHYLEFARKTYDLVNLKVNSVFNDMFKLYETVVGTSEYAVTQYSVTEVYEEWVWVEGATYNYAMRDSNSETEVSQNKEEYDMVYRLYKGLLENVMLDNPTKIEYTHKGSKVIQGDALVSGSGKMTYKVSAGENYTLVEADTDGEFIKTLNYTDHDAESNYHVAFTFIREGEFVFEKPDTTGWSTAN